MIRETLEFKNIKEEGLENIANNVFNIVEDFFKKNDRACIVFLNGDMGAGKTTFTKKLGKVFCIKDIIISPTFVLRKDYLEGQFIHIDGYRFENENEGKSLALEIEINKKGKIILIEWAERFVKSINLNPDITIDFKVINEKERDIFVNIL